MRRFTLDQAVAYVVAALLIFAGVAATAGCARNGLGGYEWVKINF